MVQAVYRFGDFSVDTGVHALLKSGTRLSIQEQPFQVLLALLERPGQVVTREALRVRLWGTDTFVDFDQSLNSALRRLRLALEDNSRDPIYVETIPRVGFRFLPEVSVETVVPFTSPEVAEPSTAMEEVPAAVLAASASSASAVPASNTRPSRFPGVAGLVATLTFVFGLFLGALPSQWRRVVEPDGVAASSRRLSEGAKAPDRVSASRTTGFANDSAVYPAQSSAVEMSELEGWYHLKQRSQGDYIQARAAFERTLATRPQQASALVGLGQTEILMALNGDAPGNRLQHARSVGRQALLVSPHLAAAHTVIGAADALADWNDAEAEQEFRTAMHLEPDDSLTHLWYAVFVLMPRRQYRQAEAEAMVSVGKDPLSLIAHTNLGWILYTEGKRQAALEQYRFVLHLKPDFVPAQFRVDQLLRAEGQAQDGDLRQIAALSSRNAAAAHGAMPNTSEISTRCADLPLPDSNDPHAISVLRTGIKEHCLQEFFFGQNPELAKLGKSPAFAELLKAAHPLQ